VLAASDLDKHCSIPWPDDVKAALLACMPQDQEDS
jgi:4-hydroxybenzoyl-CoA thioesterase